jgi:RNA polymerase sigma factor (sigma-70 family)
MAIAELFPVLHYLHKLAAERHPETVTDTELLAQFSARRDDAAFTTLVQRHGRMVWNVCRRLVRDWQAAEDAFQATFMVLARKAAVIRTPERLSCWLYGVAHRTALKARTDRARRRLHEQPLPDQPAKAAPDWEDVRPVLDQEIGRLPGPCRTAFILCYLEGKTNDQAARLLGWPKGTVATRLARARERLRGRLVRHGVTLSAAALSAMLAPDSLASALPPGLIAPTAKTALRFAAGQAVLGLSTRAATLAQGVIKTMFVSKLKLMAALTLAVAVLVSGTSTMLLSGAPSAADPSGETAAADKTKPPYELVTIAPPPSPAEQALFFSASTNFLLGHYGQASRECARFVESYPESALADRAIELGLIATQLAGRSDDDGRRQMAKAKAIINRALNGQPLATQTKQPARGGQLADAELAQAEKDFRIAEFYRKTNHPGSAFVYYEIVRRRHPGTEYAAKAAERLESLRSKKQPQETHGTEVEAGTAPLSGARPSATAPPSQSKRVNEGVTRCGHLRRALFFIDGKQAYALEDSQGQLLIYVTAQGSLNIEAYLNCKVSVTGSVLYSGQLMKYIVASQIAAAHSKDTGSREPKHTFWLGFFNTGDAAAATDSSKPQQTIAGFPVEGTVELDRQQNKAWVNGAGTIRMPSSVGIYGERLTEPDILTIHWNRDMFFDGRRATFNGGVEAEQGKSRLTCESLQLRFDRDVSLDPDPSESSAVRIESVVSDKSVRFENIDRTGDKRSRYSRLEATELSYNAEERVIVAPGPGSLRVLEVSGAAGAGSDARGFRFSGGTGILTRVDYRGRMFANNTTRTTIFYDGAELVHMPGNNADVAIDIDNLPEGALYLRCDVLTVSRRQEANADGMQQLLARGDAVVGSREFSGRADLVKYDESKELLVLEASEGNLASLVRQRAKGAAQEEVKGKKIYYWRRTNDLKIEGGIGNSTPPTGSSK